MIYLTADFIRSLSGLSVAELSDETVNSLRVIPIAEASATNYPDLTENENLYYKGYKALTILGPSLLLSLSKTIRDNFNEFTRFDMLKEFLDIAKAKVAEVEDAEALLINLLDIVPPGTDPVTQEVR